MKSKLIALPFLLVLVVGGFSLITLPTSAQAAPTPTPSPTTPPPTPGPTVTVTKTVTATVTVIKTIYVTKTQIKVGPKVVVTKTVIKMVTPTSSSNTLTGSVLAENGPAASGSKPWVFWGLGAAGMIGVALTAFGLAGIMKRRRYRGSHFVDEDTLVMPVVQSDDYSISDYHPGEGDTLGSSWTEHPPSVGDVTQEISPPPGDADTKVLPPVE